MKAAQLQSFGFSNTYSANTRVFSSMEKESGKINAKCIRSFAFGQTRDHFLVSSRCCCYLVYPRFDCSYWKNCCLFSHHYHRSSSHRHEMERNMVAAVVVVVVSRWLKAQHRKAYKNRNALRVKVSLALTHLCARVVRVARVTSALVSVKWTIKIHLVV